MSTIDRLLLRPLRLLLPAAALLASTGFHAGAADIRGRMVDAANDEALIQASVRLLTARDSSLVTGSVTNDNGAFRLKNIKAGSYIVEASYVGFTTVYKPVRVADADVRMGVIKLSESSIMLAEATVTAVRTVFRRQTLLLSLPKEVQIFISTTEVMDIPCLEDRKFHIWKVEDGCISKQ